MPPDRHPGLKGLYLMPSKCRVAHLDEPFVCIKHSVGTAAALSFDDRVLVFSAVSHDHQPFVTFILFLSNHWKALLGNRESFSMASLLFITSDYAFCLSRLTHFLGSSFGFVEN